MLLDGLLRAERALPLVAHIARATSDSVHLVQVVSLPIDYSGGLAPGPLLSQEVIESDIAGGTEYLKAVAGLMLAGIETTTKVF